MGFLHSSLGIVSELKAACLPRAANRRWRQEARASNMESRELTLSHDRTLIRRSSRLKL